jgi:hypothetical protein
MVLFFMEASYIYSSIQQNESKIQIIAITDYL